MMNTTTNIERGLDIIKGHGIKWADWRPSLDSDGLYWMNHTDYNVGEIADIDAAFDYRFKRIQVYLVIRALRQYSPEAVDELTLM